MKHDDGRPLEERIAWTVQEARTAIAERRGYREDPHTGCFLAQRRTRAGYGSFLTVYEAVYGAVPPGWVVYHRCGNGAVGCIRPTHLDIAEEGAPVHTRDMLPAIVAHDFAQRIAAERVARRATLQQFARELGVAQNTLDGWERGINSPTVDQLGSLTRKLGWADEPQRWVVTVVVQQFVIAASAGDAAREVLEDIEREDGDRHLAVYSVIAGRDIPAAAKKAKGRNARRASGIPTIDKVLKRSGAAPKSGPA